MKNSFLDIRNQDNIELMKEFKDNHFDMAIVDPPYGINGNAHRRNKTRGKACNSKKYHNELWNQGKPSEKYFNELIRVSKNQIIFGINYFNYPILSSPGRLFWDKVNGNSSYSDGEIAYCSMFDSVRVVRYMWSGMLQGRTIGRNKSIMNGDKSKNEVRIHPTQKPVILYEYLIKKYCEPGFKVLDTHFGSGSLALAIDKCNNLDNMGLSLVACEIDKIYYNDSIERIKSELSKEKLKFYKNADTRKD